MKNAYRNYIFDLYGTLLDIRTDERSADLWKTMCVFYNAYGCEWEAEPLRDAFFRRDAAERRLLAARSGAERPEIRIERVFAALLLEGCAHHSCSLAVADSGPDLLREEYKEDAEAVIERVAGSEWAAACAVLFRTASREYIRPYPNTMAILKTLRENGCRLFLLSNAQRLFTMPEIEAFGLQDLLDRICISSDYGVMKPEPAFLNTLMAEEGLAPEETVLAGNEIESDIAAAVRGGIRSIYLNTFDLGEEEINRRIAEVLRAWNAPEDLAPRIIRSGDIGEILSDP